MEKMWVIKVIVFSLLIQYLLVLSANAQTNDVTGESFLILDNKKDIYHKKNKLARHEMIEAAVFDAIDKGASQRVNSIIEHVQQSTSISRSFEDVFEDYLSTSLTKINVEWKRTSSYKFAREETEKGEKGKKWKCEVSGTVRNIGTIPSTSKQSQPKTENDYYITRKSFNIVHVNAGTKDDINIGDKLIAYKYKGKKALTGVNMKPKLVGLITITHTEDNYSEGRILRGTFSVKEAHQAKKYNFKKFRNGLEYQLAGSYEQVNTTEFGETESTVNSTTHSVFYYYYSYISRIGFKLGLEMMDIKKTYPATEFNPYQTDSSAYVFNPKFNLNYSIGLIPDFLFIMPNASIGYLFFENGKEEIFDRVGKAWDADMVLEADISAHLRLRSFDLVGGITFKYINDYPELKNYYPHVGIAYNFVRYAKKGLAGEE